jgi:hypothetical protein
VAFESGSKQVLKDGEVFATIRRVHETDHLSLENTIKEVKSMYFVKGLQVGN